MKKFLSLIMVAAMLVAVFAMVGCDDPVETTTNSTTTAATTTTASTPAETTTTATTPAETTTTATEPTNTTITATEPTDTTTTATEPTETTTTVAPPASTGSTVSVFARFDFGTATKAEAEGKTSHAYLTGALAIDDSKIAVEYTEDTIIVYAKANATAEDNDNRTAFSLNFNDIVTFDFDDELMNGYGGFNKGPLNPGTTWVGRHQFVKVRMRNFTTNNVMSIWYSGASNGGQYYTTEVSGNMFLHGGAAAGRQTTTVDSEWKTFNYDMIYLTCVTRGPINSGIRGEGYTDFDKISQTIKDRNDYYGHSAWATSGTIAGLRFGVLGAYDPLADSYPSEKNSDSRRNIKMGDKVEIDYIVFGSSIEQLQGYTSYIEDAANAAA